MISQYYYILYFKDDIFSIKKLVNICLKEAVFYLFRSEGYGVICVAISYLIIYLFNIKSMYSMLRYVFPIKYIYSQYLFAI